MAKKTVIHKACKPIIDSSSDESLLAHYARQSADDADAAEADEDAEEDANQEDSDTDGAPAGVDPETGEVTEKPSAAEKEAEPF